jgi:hypothetical protein
MFAAKPGNTHQQPVQHMRRLLQLLKAPNAAGVSQSLTLPTNNTANKSDTMLW